MNIRRAKLLPFVRQYWPAFGILLIACCAVIWFAANIFLDFLYFNDPRHQDSELKPWMTPRYIVMSYDLPRPKVMEILELPERDLRGMRMSEIAASLGLTLEELTQRVRDAAEEYRASGS